MSDEAYEVLRRSSTPLHKVVARGRLRAALAMFGPAFVASVAYVDPGNFATNVQRSSATCCSGSCSPRT